MHAEQYSQIIHAFLLKLRKWSNEITCKAGVMVGFESFRRYSLSSLAGFALGFVLLHPVSMIFQSLVHPGGEIAFSEILNAFNIHHIPMAFFFGLFGAVVSAVLWFYHSTVVVAQNRIRVLEGLLPICMYCKKIRDDTGVEKGEGKWHEIEHYIASRTDADFTHGICQDCYDKVMEEELEENASSS